MLGGAEGPITSPWPVCFTSAVYCSVLTFCKIQQLNLSPLCASPRLGKMPLCLRHAFLTLFAPLVLSGGTPSKAGFLAWQHNYPSTKITESPQSTGSQAVPATQRRASNAHCHGDAQVHLHHLPHQWPWPWRGQSCPPLHLSLAMQSHPWAGKKSPSGAESLARSGEKEAGRLGQGWGKSNT